MTVGKIKQVAFSEGTTVTGATDVGLSSVGLTVYASEAAFVSANGAATDGDAFYDSTDDAVKVYVNGTWRTQANTTETQTLSGKTLTAPTVGDYLLLTEGSAPSTPAAGKLALFAKTDKKLYMKNSDGTETAVGSGAGEKNYIQGTSTASGWANVGDLDVATTTTAADLPREHTTASGIKITADANTQSVADYVYYDFTLDDVDLSKKLKIQWSQKVTGTYTAGQLAVGITTQADRTTFLHTPVTTDIPAADGVFTTSFDASTTATLSLVIRATTDMTTDGGIVISDVVVGPGIQPQGAVVGPSGQAITLTIVNGSTTNLAGTNAAYFTRRGDRMLCNGAFTANGAATGSGSFRIQLPATYTIATNLVTGSVGAGYASDSDGAQNRVVVTLGVLSSTQLTMTYGGEPGETNGGLLTDTAPFTWANGDIVNYWFDVPIAEWAGSGTVNLTQNDVEYAYNSSATASNDTTSFGYGPSGMAIQAFAPAATTGVQKRVRFQTPFQAGDRVELQFRVLGTNNWIAAGDAGGNFTGLYDGTTHRYVGALLSVGGAGTTDVDVYFYSGVYWRAPSAAVRAWSTFAGAECDMWRVAKYAGGAAVGFGQVTQSSAGLVKSAGQLLGTNTNDSAATGYVGEYLSQSRLYASATALATATTINVTASPLTLTAGDWEIGGVVVYQATGGAAAVSATQAAISVTSATLPSSSTIGVANSDGEMWTAWTNIAEPSSGNSYTLVVPTHRVSLSASDDFYLVARATISSGSLLASGSIWARRVR